MDQIPAVVEYVTFDVNQIPSDIKKSDELKTYILLKTQGSCIELIESPKIALSMFVFNVMHQVCPEVVLKLANGKRYVLYNHNPDPVIHPVDVNDAFALKETYTTTNLYQEEDLRIDLGEIWHSLLNSSHAQTFEAKIPMALEMVKPLIHHINFTFIIGNAPLFLILATQHLIGNNTKQLFYQRSLDSMPKRIK